jgi:hypothetical protein
LPYLYSIALIGVVVMILAALVEAIVALHRRPGWTLPRLSLTLVKTVDRREVELPFVGDDRRGADDPAEGQRKSA